MVRPVIALLTDFGTRGHYAGAMKAVVLGICPDATLVDITHDIPPHDVLAAALELAACFKYFPPGTIFLTVVDPGVGSARRGLAVDAGDYRFVAPDNGVLTAVLKETPARRAVELTERRYARPTVSKTFEGRDRFAPAAGWIAKGVDLSALGRPAGEINSSRSGGIRCGDADGRSAASTVWEPGDEYRSPSSRHILAVWHRISAGDHRIGRVVTTCADAAPTKCARSLAAPTISNRHQRLQCRRARLMRGAQ